MMVFNVVLLNFTFVFPHFMRQIVSSIAFLYQNISSIPLIANHPSNPTVCPSGVKLAVKLTFLGFDLAQLLCTALRSRNVLTVQFPCDVCKREPFCDLLEDAPDNYSFLLNDFNCLILVAAFAGNHLTIVAVSIDVNIPHISTLKAHLIAKVDVAGDASAFLLRNSPQCSKDEFTGRVCCIEIFFLE